MDRWVALRAMRGGWDGEADIATICCTLGISRATLYCALKDPEAVASVRE